MIVEFVGESGCGKSTLAKSVLANTPNARKKGSLTTKDNLKAFFKVLSKKDTRRIFSAIVSLELKENGLSRFFRNTLYVAGLIRILQSEKAKPSVWIIDQGLIQFLQTVYYKKSPKNDRYAKLVRMLIEGYDYRIVACSCDYGVLCERIGKRKNNSAAVGRRIENAGPELFKLHEKNLETFLNRVPDKLKIAVDTAADIEYNTKKICDFVANGDKNQ